MPARLTPPHAALLAVLAAGLAGRAWGAFDDGIFWPDEIYQSFEIAHAMVFGHGLIPWEFVDGARNYSVPAVVAALLKLAQGLGLDSPPGYIRLVKLAFAVLSTVTGLGVARLAAAFKASPWAQVAAVATWALAAPAIYFAPRAMSENLCVAPLVWGVALLFEHLEGTQALRPQRLLLAGSLLGLAVLFRLQTAVVVTGVVLALAVARRWRALGWTLGALGAWAVVYGALDRLTWHQVPGTLWGGWFHSAVVYVRFNVIENRAAQWGTSPWWFYFAHLFKAMPTVAVLLGAGVLGAAQRRTWVLPWLTACFFALHIASPHKEFRFLMAGLPLACACVGVAWQRLAERWVSGGVVAAVALSLVSALHTPSLTMGELGAYLDRPQSPAWGDMGNVNRLILLARQQRDLCGLRVDGVDMAWAGGFTYLHSAVPLYRPNQPPQLRHFNYLIGPQGYQGDLQQVGEDHGLVLYRLPIAQCEPDPGYQWRL